MGAPSVLKRKIRRVSGCSLRPTTEDSLGRRGVSHSGRGGFFTNFTNFTNFKGFKNSAGRGAPRAVFEILEIREIREIRENREKRTPTKLLPPY